MASDQKTARVLTTSSQSLAPPSPASLTHFETDESDDCSSTEDLSRQDKPNPQERLPCWQETSTRWQDIVRPGLPEVVKQAGLPDPKIAMAGSALVFVWSTQTETYIALPEALECGLLVTAYGNPHQYDVSDAISLLPLCEATSLAIQLARDKPESSYRDIFFTLQALVRADLQHLQQERFWDNIQMSQVPCGTPNRNNSFAKYLFLVFLAQIGTPAHLTYIHSGSVVSPDAIHAQQEICQGLGETYLVRQAYLSGAVTVLYRLLNGKGKVLARLSVDELHEIAKHGISYDAKDLEQWRGLESWSVHWEETE